MACSVLEHRKTMMSELLQFYDVYESARRQLLSGERAVAFPAGTVLLRLYANVACLPPQKSGQFGVC